MEIKDHENLKFYNYIPMNKELKKLCVTCPRTEEYEEKLNEELEEQLKNVFQDNILDQINAKNINTDLKRDLQKKLNILSRKTDKAIIELIKRKINENKDKSGSNEIDEDDENVNISLNFGKKNDKNFGHILYHTLNKLDNMEDSD